MHNENQKTTNMPLEYGLTVESKAFDANKESVTSKQTDPSKLKKEVKMLSKPVKTVEFPIPSESQQNINSLKKRLEEEEKQKTWYKNQLLSERKEFESQRKRLLNKILRLKSEKGAPDNLKFFIEHQQKLRKTQIGSQESRLKQKIKELNINTKAKNKLIQGERKEFTSKLKRTIKEYECSIMDAKYRHERKIDKIVSYYENERLMKGDNSKTNMQRLTNTLVEEEIDIFNGFERQIRNLQEENRSLRDQLAFLRQSDLQSVSAETSVSWV